MATFDRMFSDEELELFATPLSIRLERAADARDGEEIARIQEQMDMETLAIYDAYVRWIGTLQTFIVDRAGEGAHDEALRWAGEHAFRDFVLAYRGLGVRERVERIARYQRAAGSTFTVEEDDARVRFTLDPFAGGSRLWRPIADWQAELPRTREGDRYLYPNHDAYEPPISFASLSGARPLTQGRDELPCFFAVEVLYWELLPIELLGYPIAVITLPDAPEAPAHLDVHKDGTEVPAEAYERVGTSKPGAGLPVEKAKRVFDDDELERLGVPLSLQVEAAAADGDWDRMREVAAGYDAELVGAKDPLGILISGLLSWIARHQGEDAAEEALARTAEVVMAPFVDTVRDMDIRDAIPMWAMVWRSHGSTYWIEEHEDTFVFRGRPLGACHRMWSHAYQRDVERISDSRVRYPTFGSYDPPACHHLMREPRGISYMKPNYPIYSCHCHMLHEIYATDQLGYPLWVEEHPLDDPDGETVHIHYKDPAEWPEHYYERIGRKKPASVPA